MAYNFKSIADVEVVAEPTESANVLIEENGIIKKAPKTAVGGGDGVRIVTYNYYYDYDNEIGVFELDGVKVRANDVKREWLAGSILRVHDEQRHEYGIAVAFSENFTSDGDWANLYYCNDGSINSISLEY